MSSPKERLQPRPPALQNEILFGNMVIADGIHQDEVIQEWGVPLIHATAVKTETHGEGRGWSDCLKVEECPGFLAATGSQEREKRKDPLPQSLHSEGGGSGDTLMSDFRFPEQRENKSLLSHAVWGTLGSPGKRT